MLTRCWTAKRITDFLSISHHSQAFAFCFLSSLWDFFLLTSAQPSAMGGPSDRAVQVSQIKPVAKGGGKKGSAKDAEGNPVVNYPTTLEEPKVYCPQGHEVLLSRIPWQAGCNKCSGHNGWSSQIISQYYNQILDQCPLIRPVTLINIQHCIYIYIDGNKHTYMVNIHIYIYMYILYIIYIYM